MASKAADGFATSHARRDATDTQLESDAEDFAGDGQSACRQMCEMMPRISIIRMRRATTRRCGDDDGRAVSPF